MPTLQRGMHAMATRSGRRGVLPAAWSAFTQGWNRALSVTALWPGLPVQMARAALRSVYKPATFLTDVRGPS